MKVMLAATVSNVMDLTFKYPLLVSPKLDGIRATVRDGVVWSRNAKPIPNKHVQRTFNKPCFDRLDGELIVGLPTSPTCYRDTMSGVMSADGEPDATFWVFDYLDDNLTFVDRLKAAIFYIKGRPGAQHVHHELVNDRNELQVFEEKCLEVGYEGVMLRNPIGKYKHGRSTLNEGGLLKLKRFKDGEALIIGVEERMHNGNEATLDELGRTKRTSHQANKTGRGDLGALVCRLPDGTVFNIGTGFSDAERAGIWDNETDGNHTCIGMLAKFKYFPTGSKDAPRFPVFIGFRSKDDC